MPSMRGREEIRAYLTGPIASVRTLFHRDGSIDFYGLRKSLDFAIDAGSKTLLLTYGDSLYSLLTDQEVAEVTRVVAEHAAGRALVVAADRIWATPKAVEFAKYTREVGADVLMVLPPDWAASCTPRTFTDHYAAVAEHIPVMVVTNAFVARGMEMALEILQMVHDEVENVVAVKDDWCNDFARKLSLLVHDRWAVIAGGQKQYHLDMLLYGCDGYLSTFISFKPHIAWEYWQATQAGNLVRAKEIIRDYDMPFFDFIISLPGGFDAGIHGTLEIFGLGQRWRRRPYYSLNDEEMERLRHFYQQHGLL